MAKKANAARKEKGAKKGRPGAEKGLHAFYIELDSMRDLARQLMGRSSHIKAFRDNSEYMLSVQGEKMGDTRLIYFIRSKAIGKFLLYDPDVEGIEHAEITDSMPDHPEFKSLRVPIMVLESNPYSEGKLPNDSVTNVKATDFDSFVKALAAMHEDGSPKIYAFFDNSDHITGTFDMFRESGTKVFTFTKAPFEKPFGAIRYNYMTGKASAVDSFADNSSIYIKTVNLKAPFPFFKQK